MLQTILEALVTALQFTHGSNARLLHGLAVNAPLLRSLQTIPMPQASPMPQPMPQFAAGGGRDGSTGRSAATGGGGGGGGSENGYLAGPEVWMTAEWMAGWQAGLPVAPLLRVAEVIGSKVSVGQLASPTVPEAIQSMSLAGLLPPPPPIALRHYQPSEHSNAWMTQVIWGIIYSRNQDLHDARAVRLVQILQLDD